jgi:futalosine hydrolase
VVVATEEIFADEGAQSPEGFLDLERLNLPLGRHCGQPLFNRLLLRSSSPRAPRKAGKTPEDDELERLVSLYERELTAEFGGRFAVHRGPMATVSTISGTAEAAREIYERWAPLAEAMEGAAAALCCIRVGCPFQEIRGISNFVGDRDRAKWDIPTAIENAAEVAAVSLESVG